MGSMDRKESVPRSGLEYAVRTLERSDELDLPARLYDLATRTLLRGRVGPLLRGRWLGHSLHPQLTDVPLGCWLAAGFLDLFGRKESQPAAQKLVGVGLLASVPTALSGAAEWLSLFDRSTRRVAVAHASGNVAVVALYFLSWRLRRNGSRRLGVLAGMAGGVLSLFTGYLGGHLSFGRSVGHGERWEEDASDGPG
jgi:uncharacterized membrane protein